MDYDFRNRAASPYDPTQSTIYRPQTSSSSSSHPMYGQGQQTSLYPRIGQQGHTVVPPASRTSSYHQSSPPSSSSGLGIRVAIKPEYRITPPPQLAPQVGDITRSTFHFDFDLERKIVAEAEKDSQNWSRIGLENLPSKTAESPSSLGSTTNPVVSKYVASGLSREAVPLAVAHYGDNPTKVQEFVNGYNRMREMGFSSKNIAEALIMFENDTERAVAHIFNNSS